MYVDADFSENSKKNEAHERDSACSRYGYIIGNNSCPILWKSQLQLEIALLSTESKYIGILHALCYAIPVIGILRKMKAFGIPIGCTKSKIHCRVFEDNRGALEMEKVHKYRPCTKHVNVKYHHFRDYVNRGVITINTIGTNKEPADILTKPVNVSTLRKHKYFIMG